MHWRDSKAFRFTAISTLVAFGPLAVGCAGGPVGSKSIEILVQNESGVGETVTYAPEEFAAALDTDIPGLAADGEPLAEPAALLRGEHFEITVGEDLVLTLERDGDSLRVGNADADGTALVFTWDADLERMWVETGAGESVVELRGVPDRTAREAFFGHLVADTLVAAAGGTDDEVAYFGPAIVITIILGFYGSMLACWYEDWRCEREARSSCGAAGVAFVDARCKGAYLWVRLVCKFQCNPIDDGGTDEDCAWTDLYGGCIVAY